MKAKACSDQSGQAFLFYNLYEIRQRMKYKISTHSKKLLADTLTPVNIYLKLRDVFAGSILLESSDYHGHENSLSYICCEPIASFEVKEKIADIHFPDGQTQQ